jgi:hypothetical protein
MRLVTWNVNGVRSLQAYHPWNSTRLVCTVLDSFGADIVCFQETKITRDRLDADLALAQGYDACVRPRASAHRGGGGSCASRHALSTLWGVCSYYAFCRTRSGYSGTATYCRRGSAWSPCAAEDGVNGTWLPPAAAATATTTTAAEARIGHYVSPEERTYVRMCLCMRIAFVAVWAFASVCVCV